MRQKDAIDRGFPSATVTLANGAFDLASTAGAPYLYLSTAQIERFGGDVADAIVGTRGGDAIRALGDDDVVALSGGVDYIDGGDGDDTLTGGSGADSFVFSGGDVSAERLRADRITDFSRADGDRINLRRIDANIATADDDGFAFIGNRAFDGIAGQLRVERVEAETIIFGDTDGNGVADFQIRCVGSITFLARDFVL